MQINTRFYLSLKNYKFSNQFNRQELTNSESMATWQCRRRMTRLVGWVSDIVEWRRPCWSPRSHCSCPTSSGSWTGSDRCSSRRL